MYSKDKVNTDNIDDMLNDKATYYVSQHDTYYSNKEAYNEIKQLLIERGLDIENFEVSSFMERLLLSKPVPADPKNLVEHIIRTMDCSYCAHYIENSDNCCDIYCDFDGCKRFILSETRSN